MTREYLWWFPLTTGSSNIEILCTFPLPTSDPFFLSFYLPPGWKLANLLFFLVLCCMHRLTNDEQTLVAWICLNTFSQQIESPDLSCKTASVSHRSCAPLSLKCPLLPFSLSRVHFLPLGSSQSELRSFLLSVPEAPSAKHSYSACYINHQLLSAGLL